QESYAGSVAEMCRDEIEPLLRRIQAPVFLMSPAYVGARRLENGTTDAHLITLVAERRALMYEQFPGIARSDTFVSRDAQFFPMMSSPARYGFVLSQFLKRLDDQHAGWDSTAASQPSPR